MLTLLLPLDELVGVLEDGEEELVPLSPLFLRMEVFFTGTIAVENLRTRPFLLREFPPEDLSDNEMASDSSLLLPHLLILCMKPDFLLILLWLLEEELSMVLLLCQNTLLGIFLKNLPLSLQRSNGDIKHANLCRLVLHMPLQVSHPPPPHLPSLLRSVAVGSLSHHSLKYKKAPSMTT
ncbi:hypothetical protein Prudu_015127 [Prunus dulcis]|uniref:Uncharacterized protein n=1 Tax=Prunus dulcis TaxID=3755 RepID=A0A4Y1RIC9_PRUDU|nr:hypothetical protein Prudu_015127 [Prunus dulcis]